jgi:capsular exopolysaccharide synthesis family protein
MYTNEYSGEYIDFQKYWLVLKRRWLPATATCLSAIALSFCFAMSKQEELYQAKAQILIEKSNKSTQFTGIQNNSSEIENVTKDGDPLATQAEILQSRPILERVILELDLRSENGELLNYGAVSGNLKAEPLLGTDIIEVSYEDPEPVSASAIANKVIEIYMEDDTASNRAEAIAARQFMSEQLPQLEQNVNQAEAELRDFKNQNQLANLPEETSELISKNGQLENQIEEVTAELESINARYNLLSGRLGLTQEQAAAMNALNESVAVRQTFEKLQEVKLSIASERNRFSESAPQMINWREQERELQSLLDQQIAQNLSKEQQAAISQIKIFDLGQENQQQIPEFISLGLEREGLLKELASFKDNLRTNQQRLASLPGLEKQQRELSRRLEAAQSTYQTLLGKLQETQVIENQNIGNVRVIESAIVPTDPIPSKTKLIVAAGGVAGVLLGIGVAFLLDLRDNKVKNSKEVEDIFARSVQGVIPNLKKIEPNQRLTRSTVGNLPQPAATNSSMRLLREACQNIHINLKLLDKEAAYKVIAVTSATPQEGKSSVSANLALAKAQSGQRILLVDGDLRVPTQHHIWQIANEIGLTNVLHEEIEWRSAIQEVMPNLDILTSGPIPESPPRLLYSEPMKALVVSLASHYDQIIFDTPPLMGIADTKILGNLVDGFLFVVRVGVAPYHSVVEAKKFLDTSDLKLLGIVVNGVDRSKEHGHSSYYYQNKKYLEAG